MKGFTNEWIKQKESNNKIAIPIADLEQPIRDAPLETQESPRFTSQVNIHIHSYRKRLADPDGISGKAVIDQITSSGLLKDDSSQFVKEVRYSQSKAEIEETVVTIEEI